MVAAGVFVAGVTVSLGAQDAGGRLMGVGMLALALWLARNDIARHTIRLRGQTRFIALCLLAGYVWLAVAGVLWTTFGYAAAGPKYDATLHTVFLGFVISMVFGHELIILPAVLGVGIRFGSVFYAHLVLLHASLVLRLLGDAASTELWRWGGMLNVVAILLFMATTVRAVILSRRRSTLVAPGGAAL